MTTTQTDEIGFDLPDAETLERLKLAPEIAWFLLSRGYPLPTCPPAIKTPDPPDVLEGVSFDPDRVDDVLRSFARIQHTQGRWHGQILKPSSEQLAYIIAPVFGWVQTNDEGLTVRVVRTEYVEMPRKGGKTTISGGQALYLAADDHEPGAQILIVAAGKEQARNCYDPVKRIVERSAVLRRDFKPLANRITHRESGSFISVVSSAADLIHGSNPHGAIIDELHAHKNRDVVDAIESGTGSRTQPLVVIITTADNGMPGTIYAERRGLVEQLASGALKDPSHLGGRVVRRCGRRSVCRGDVEEGESPLRHHAGAGPTCSRRRSRLSRARRRSRASSGTTSGSGRTSRIGRSTSSNGIRPAVR